MSFLKVPGPPFWSCELVSMGHRPGERCAMPGDEREEQQPRASCCSSEGELLVEEACNLEFAASLDCLQ